MAKELLKDYKIKIIYATDVDGVNDKEGKTITEINSKNFDQVKKSILGAATTDVTGGMLHKVKESLSLVKKTGIETLVINGMKAGLLRNAILGAKDEGTRIG